MYCFTKGTTNEYKQKVIEEMLHKEVKISLPQKNIYGMLVECKDHKDLLKKGMVRFVFNETIDTFFDTGKEHITRIFNYNDFQTISENVEKS